MEIPNERRSTNLICVKGAAYLYMLNMKHLTCWHKKKRIIIITPIDSIANNFREIRFVLQFERMPSRLATTILRTHAQHFNKTAIDYYRLSVWCELRAQSILLPLNRDH